MADINSIFPSRYLKASDLDGREITVVVKGIKIENVGQNKQSKPVAYFKGTEKGLVLNITNSKRIAKIAGSNDTDDWTGVKIVLYGTETEFGGELVSCIRVRGVKGTVEGKKEQPSKKAKRESAPKIQEPEPDDPMPEPEESNDHEAYEVSDEDEDPIPF